MSGICCTQTPRKTTINRRLDRPSFIFQMVERILWVWAIRHPASGYVQGINDLVVPFLFVFLTEFYGEGVSRVASECHESPGDRGGSISE